MPYKLKRAGAGYKVISPNHQQGFSKNPMTKRDAMIQLWIIEKKTKGK